MLRNFLLGSCCLAGLLPVGVAAESAPQITADWARDAVWDDGLAEVAVYEAERRIYGEARPYEAVLLTVKEEFDGERLVKADTPYGDRPIVTVIKQNAVREIATPNYDYRIMTSTFVERDDPTRIVKLTSGSHEWCGNTWKAVRRLGEQARFEWSSYFDGEADGSQQIALAAGNLLEDQLPLALRGLAFGEGLRFDLRLLPSMATTHGGPLAWEDASLRVTGREAVEVPAGSISAWRVEIVSHERTLRLWFDVEGTHALVRSESPTGDSFRLKRIERRAYWRLP